MEQPTKFIQFALTIRYNLFLKQIKLFIVNFYTLNSLLSVYGLCSPIEQSSNSTNSSDNQCLPLNDKTCRSNHDCCSGFCSKLNETLLNGICQPVNISQTSTFFQTQVDSSFRFSIAGLVIVSSVVLISVILVLMHHAYAKLKHPRQNYNELSNEGQTF